MKLDVLYFIVLGYFIDVSDGGGGGHHDKHVKIYVPAIIHKHTHKDTVYKKVPSHDGGHDKKHIVIHKHEHNHHHKHDHGHKHGHDHKHKHGHKHGHNHKADHGHKHGHDHKHGHKHDHKHKHAHKKKDDDHGWHGWSHYESEPVVTLEEEESDQGWTGYKSQPVVNLEEQKSQYEYNDLNPVSFDDDGYKTSKKSVRSEHFEVKSLNPDALYTGDKYIVRGSYKVQETDPFDFITTSHHTYDSPVGKEIAQQLTNFGGRFDNLYPYKKEKQSEENKKDEGEGEGQEKPVADHEDIEEYGGLRNYEDYGDNIEVVHAYAGEPSRNKQTISYTDYHVSPEEIEYYITGKLHGNVNNAK